MLSRLLASFYIAIMGVIAATSPALAAASSPDQDQIMLGTILLLVGMLTLLFCIWLVKHYFGLDKMPPAPADDGHGGHH